MLALLGALLRRYSGLTDRHRRTKKPGVAAASCPLKAICHPLAARPLAQFAAVEGGRPAREGRPRRLLDLYLYQLAAHAALCPCVGREVQGSGSGGDRRALAGVRVRAELDNVRRAVEGRCESTIRSRSTTTMRSGAFNNHYWPALYLVDAQGRIRYHHFGEGEYEQSERIIQQLLAEAGATASPATWCQSMRRAWKLPLIGPA